MAEENGLAGNPTAPADGYSQPAEEEGEATSNELRHHKRKKHLLYGVAFAIFLAGIFVLFSITFTRIRNPQIRLQSASFSSISFQYPDNVTSSPSFNVSMNAVLGIKNTNFGPYKYDSTTVYVYDTGIQVGSATIPKSKASSRSTKKINVPVILASPTNLSASSIIGHEINAGLIFLTIQSELNGKVELMFGLKKKKTIYLDCSALYVMFNVGLQTVICS
ncbi:late embryogenesis abundant protein At1g64065-like [Rhododendron vialii]|uniref:late embryogenesis abundant protein At1g64065-like n=1 Tax=Rhododendron vialii TaxID=182163 RepID=UPI00265D6E09|nr:late embryogenesis abundant protein At1g64065-like [Rhododendron vialii]